MFILVATTWVGAEAQLTPLFMTHDLLELTMPVDFDTLCRPSEDPDCDYTPTEFRYMDSAGEQLSVPISIRRRDGWRAQQTNCQIPTLFVRFSSDHTVGTVFEGQTTLALTSHCGKGISPEAGRSATLQDEFERYVINEYLGYRLYNMVTDTSLKVRLARIEYVDPGNPRKSFTRDAFFAEHFESLAARLGAELLPAESFDPSRLDMAAADELAMFQYMVGNTDWSIEDQENVILLRFPDGRQVPVLFDLDMSGLVNAHYASPGAGVPIETVRQRYYQGYCHDETNWDSLFDEFSRLYRPAMTMLSETPGMGRGDRRLAGVYLDDFFDTVFSREKRESKIVSACQALPSGSGNSGNGESPQLSQAGIE